MKKENVLFNKSFYFTLSTIDLYKEMIAQKEYILSQQILQIGTNIGTNITEATTGISKKYFTAKMSLSLKKSRAKEYWLRRIDKSELVAIDVQNLFKDVAKIVNLLTAMVKTSPSN